jgi:hypothetical protein
MCTRQWKVRYRVIEGGRLPGDRGVALLASRGKAARHVIRIRRPLKVFLMARNASRARQVVVVVDVAVHAGPGRNRVPASQWESRRIVIKLRTQPVVRPVALFASGRVSEGDVVRGRGLLEVRLMARKARRGHGLELAVGRVLVAGIAIYRSVSAGQGETIIVLLNFVNRYSPSAHGVALLTICAQLAPMNVGVAVLAACGHVAEHRLHVALRTRHILVQAAQRITGPVVIEFRNGADRLPALCGVTVLTGEVQIAMGAMGTGGTLDRPARKRA